MDLPTIERGMAILADHINRITREVRANQLTAVVGGHFNRSAMGTTINIDQGFWGSSGGGAVCPFRVTNISTDLSNKVSIASGMVDGTWPKGMGPDLPDPQIVVTGSGYIYLKITYDANFTPLDNENGYIFEFHESLQTNDESHQYIVIAVIQMEAGKIKKVTSQCIQPAANPCSLNLPDPTP